MNKNDPFAKVFSDAPRFEVPPVSRARVGAVGVSDPFASVFSDAPVFEVPGGCVFDSDGDGVIDPWDCQPFNPEEDSLFGDVWKKYVAPKVKKYKSSYKKYSSSGKKYVKKYASSGKKYSSSGKKYVKKYSSSGKKYTSPYVKKYTKTIKKYTPAVKQFTKVDFERAADRRATVKQAVSAKAAPVTAAVRAAVARAPIHSSSERAADRRADVASALGVDFERAAERRADVVRGISAVVARAPIHSSGERAADRRADLASTLGVDFERAADRRADVVRGVTAVAKKISPIGVAAAAPGEPDKPGEARQRMIDAGVLEDRPTTITTGVGGVPGQPDRAGDVHAHVGVPLVAPGARGEDAPGEDASFWESLSTWARPVTQPLGLYGAPVEKQAMQKELGEYEAAHAKADEMAAAYDVTYSGVGLVSPEQGVVADADRLAVLEQQDLATREYGEYVGALGGYEGARESWFGKTDKRIATHVPTLYDVSDAGESFRETHKAKIDVVRGGYEKYSPQVARDVVYPYAGALGVHGVDYVRTHLGSIAATAAAFVVAPVVLGAAAGTATAVKVGSAVSRAPVVGRVIRAVGPTVTKHGMTGLTALWGGSAGYRVAKAETPEEKGKVSAEILFGEALPFAVAGGVPVVVKAMPKIVRTKEYTGLVTRGHVKPVYETIEVPKITRGGVIEADLLRTPPTVPKTVVTGQTMTSPKPLLGIRTTKYTSPEGITTTHKGLQVGKGWTPAEITKMSGTKFTPTAEGTQMSAVDMMQARVGQFRYTHEGWAVGKMDAGYFLPKGKGPLQLTTAEKGLIPLQDAPLLLKEGVHTPTRVYGEVVKPYARVGEMPLAGSPARMQWVELGTRKLSYGVPGGVGQPQVKINLGAKTPRPASPKFAGESGVTGTPRSPTPPEYALSAPAIPPMVHIPQWGVRPPGAMGVRSMQTREVQIGREISEIRGKMGRLDSMFGPPDVKAAWRTHNREVNALERELANIRAAEEAQTAAELVGSPTPQAMMQAAQKVLAASRPPVKLPRKIEIEREVRDLREKISHVNLLYGTPEMKAAWRTYSAKVTVLEKELAGIRAAEAAKQKRAGMEPVSRSKSVEDVIQEFMGATIPPRPAALTVIRTSAEQKAWDAHNAMSKALDKELTDIRAAEATNQRLELLEGPREPLPLIKTSAEQKAWDAHNALSKAMDKELADIRAAEATNQRLELLEGPREPLPVLRATREYKKRTPTDLKPGEIERIDPSTGQVSILKTKTTQEQKPPSQMVMKVVGTPFEWRAWDAHITMTKAIEKELADIRAAEAAKQELEFMQGPLKPLPVLRVKRARDVPDVFAEAQKKAQEYKKRTSADLKPGETEQIDPATGQIVIVKTKTVQAQKQKQLFAQMQPQWQMFEPRQKLSAKQKQALAQRQKQMQPQWQMFEPRQKLSAKQKQALAQRQKQLLEEQQQLLGLDQKAASKQAQKQKLVQKQKQALAQRQKQKVKQVQKQKQAPILQLAQEQIVEQAQKQMVKQVQAQKVKQAQKQKIAPVQIAATDTMVAQKQDTAVDTVAKQDEYVPPPVPVPKQDEYIPPPVPVPPPPPVIEGGKYVPPPPPPPVVPDPPLYPFGDGGGGGGGGAPRRRRAHEWELKHDMMTLEGFLGGAAKPATGAFPEPDLGVPSAAKAGGKRANGAGKRAKRPGVLDVPPGW